MADDRSLKKSEFAEYMGVCTRTVDRWVAENIGPRPIFLPKRGSRREIRFSLKEIDRWLKRHTLKLRDLSPSGVTPTKGGFTHEG